MKYLRLMLSIGSVGLLCSCAGPTQQAINPKAATYNVELGLGYLQQQDMQRAKLKLLRALAQAPQSPNANGAMAYYLEITGDSEQAAYYYRQALNLAPNSGAQLNNYGAFLCRQGQYKQAESYFMRAIADRSYVNTAAVYENAGLCAMKIADFATAKRYFRLALQQDPRRLQAEYQLSKL